MTGGDGPQSGMETLFSINFATPFTLAPGHYCVVPEVEMANGEFLWLSTSNPIGASGAPFAEDLESWIRDDALAPDWLRLGTDVTGAGPYNMSFTLTGSTAGASVPEPATWGLMVIGLAGIGVVSRRRGHLRASVSTHRA